jgi:hypothetical protein
MHSLYFVRLKKESAKNSEEARSTARQVLDNNQFAGEGGYFTSHKADWFVVGGRWSGHFSKNKPEFRAGLEALKALPLIIEKQKKSADILDYLHLNAHMVTDEEKKEIGDTFLKASGGIPYFRDGYNHDGFEDDALIVDKAFFDQLKADKGMENVEIAVVDENEYMDGEETISSVTEETLLGNWLVVIDYHM